MKTIKSLLVIIIIFWEVSLHAQINDTLKVLFIGNSYTYVNNLPQIFVNLASSGGKIALVDDNTLPAYWLEQHSSNNITLNKISQGIWDFVILQEQSQVPTIEFYRYNSMYPSAIFLDSLITNQGSNTVFFMTWGRKYGGQQVIQGHYSPVFTDFYHMQDSLRSAYVEIANDLSAIVAPVGIAWGQAFTLNPSVNLWQYDNSHPTIKGSYLTACVFYAMLFNDSPIGLSYTGGLSAADAAFFQNVAYQTLTSVESKHLAKPSTFKLFQNYPNPFNASTIITYSVPYPGYINLEVYDSLGRMIMRLVNEFKQAGLYSVNINTNYLSSSVYFYRLKVGSNLVDIKKMVLIK
jgi:hypothetical protein